MENPYFTLCSKVSQSCIERAVQLACIESPKASRGLSASQHDLELSGHLLIHCFLLRPDLGKERMLGSFPGADLAIYSDLCCHFAIYIKRSTSESPSPESF